MNKKKIIIISVSICLIVCAILTFFYFYNKKDNKEIEEVKVVDNIEKYGYNLYDNKTEFYKSKFEELKNVLNSEELDEKKYAEILAELFVIDFYDLNSKVTNTDIGGLDFIHSKAKDEFISAAKDTLYKYIENNVYGGRVQELPEVSETKISSSLNKEFKSEKVTDENAYEIKIDITYKKDLKYPTSVTLTLVHEENKLYVVEVK